MAWSGVAAGKVVTSTPAETKKLSFASAAITAPRKFRKRDSLEESDENRANVSQEIIDSPENVDPMLEPTGETPSPLLPNAGGQRFSSEEMLSVWRNMKDKNLLLKSEANNGSMYQSIHLNTPALLQKDQGREGWSPFKSVSVVTAVGDNPVDQPGISSAVMSPVVPSVFDTFDAPAVPPGMGFSSPPQLVQPESIKWIYKDYQGAVQGPFVGPVMHSWWVGGHLDRKLSIRREDEEEWISLGDLILKTNEREPFLVPLPPVQKQQQAPPPLSQPGFPQQPAPQGFQQQGLQQQGHQQPLQGQQPGQQSHGPFQSQGSFQHHPQFFQPVSSWSPAVTPMSPTPWGGSQGQGTPSTFGSFFDQPFHGGHSQSSFFDDRSMWRSGSVSNAMSPALSRASSVIFPQDGPHTPTRAGSHTPLVEPDNELLELDSLPLHLKDVIGDDEEIDMVDATTSVKEKVEEKDEEAVQEGPTPALSAKEKAKKERESAKKEKKRKEKEEKQRIREKMAAEKAERLEKEAREKAEKARLEQARLEQDAIDREEAKVAHAEKERRASEEKLAREAREKEAPWSKEKKKEKPNKMSLAEIQELESVERRKKDAEEQEIAKAIRAVEEAETAAYSTQEGPSFKPTWATAPVASSPAKSLSQIQKEEEAARKKTSAAVPVGVKKYAEVLPRRAPAPVPAPAADASWTTIGAHGKRMGDDGVPVRAQTPTAPAAHMAHQYAAQAAAAQAAAVAPKPAPAPPKVLTAAESFLQWCHSALRGLNAGVNETELVGMLMTLPAEDESTEIIADIVYANSSTLDGRRFAAEFLKRRKIADGDSAVKWSEVMQHAEVAPQDDGWNTAFKVVGKKKRAV